MRDTIKNKWITLGIKISRKRIQLLDNQRKMIVMIKKDLECIQQYRKIYRRVIQEAKRRESKKYISSSKNKSKAASQIINN
jgi:hypothetical protein